MRRVTMARSAQFWSTIVLTLTGAIFVLPLVWFVGVAFKTRDEALTSPFSFPVDPQWGNFAVAWDEARLATYFPNSVIYAVGIGVGVAVFACLGGYVMARIPFRGEKLVLGLTLALMIVPFQSVMVPLRGIVESLQLDGTYWALILPVVAREIPFGIFLMRAFFRQLPEELAQAARVDGCSEWSVFWRIMLPLARPGLLTVLIFQVVFSWQLLLEPLVLVQDSALRPIVAGISFFSGQYSSNTPLIAAATLISIVPIAIFTIILQRKFIEGVTAGALK